MNREYKFRAWNKINSTMHQDITDTENWSFSYLNKDIFIWLQWTGLKDKNNIDIYEGDIIQIKHPYKDRMFSGIVSWEVYMWSCKEFFFSHYDVPSEIFSEGTEHIEVIGNIYENMELLNTKQ